MTFDELTTVTREDIDRFSITIDPSSFIARGPNGGYIAAILLRALQQRVADLEGTRPPRSLTVHYALPPAMEPAVITTDVIRAGRSLVTCSARLEQAGTPKAAALAAFSPPWPSEPLHDLAMPDVLPPESAARFEGNRPPMPWIEHWDHRFTQGAVTVADGPAITEGWIRLADGGPIDAPVVAAMTDSFPPAIFSRSDEPSPVPTVDLTIHFRVSLPDAAPPADEYVLGHFRTRNVHEGFLDEDGWLWAADGRLLAQSRQLAVRLPGSM